NPPDLYPGLYNRIRYVELPSEINPARWLFVSQRCMHCDEAGCMTVCPAPGALFRTKEGAVAYDKDKCIGCKLCNSACPFNVPRYDEKDKISKCHLCSDRIAEGLEPACAKTCPTGAIRFGERDALLSSARQKGYTKVYGEADLGGLGTLYAFKDSPKVYGMDESPRIPETIALWNSVLKPLAYLGLGGAVAASLIHYIAVGPKKDKDEEGGEE
ncbi:MAG: 4Fe-4S dicluster domain-containing protein, partial [Thermodesulfovibrionales bacterium]